MLIHETPVAFHKSLRAWMTRQPVSMLKGDLFCCIFVLSDTSGLLHRLLSL